jgi:hemolysin III
MTQEIWPFWGVREPISAGSHFPAFLCAIYATLLLWRLCRGDRQRQWVMLCYGLSMIAQYGASTLYHSIRATPGILHFLRLLDQSAIFCLIAGSYTPTLYVLIRDPARRRFLIKAVWTLAVLGILSRWLWPHEPYWLTVSVYIGFGLGGLPILKELWQAVGYRGMLWVFYGGVFYIAGAVLDYCEWPLLYPGVFAHHELFHLFTLGGTFCHYAFILIYVVPYGMPEREAIAAADAGPAFALAASHDAPPGRG